MTTLQLQTPTATRKFWSGMVLFCLALLIAPVVATQLGGNYWVRVIDFALLYIMLALGLNIVVGYTGLLDMGFIAFYAVGAYLAALLASPHLLEVFPILNVWFPDGLHTSYLLIIPLAALVAAVCGILLGAPTLKLRGDYLAIVTLGFGEIIRILMRNLDRPVNITNGAKGITGVDTLNLFGLKFSGVYHWLGFKVPALWLWYYLLMLVIVAIIFSACACSIPVLVAPGTPSVKMRMWLARWASTCVTISYLPLRWAPLLAAWREPCSARSRALSPRNPSRYRNPLPCWRWWCWAGWDTFRA